MKRILTQISADYKDRYFSLILVLLCGNLRYYAFQLHYHLLHFPVREAPGSIICRHRADSLPVSFRFSFRLFVHL